jgi:hypothetical protein
MVAVIVLPCSNANIDAAQELGCTTSKCTFRNIIIHSLVRVLIIVNYEHSLSFLLYVLKSHVGVAYRFNNRFL